MRAGEFAQYLSILRECSFGDVTVNTQEGLAPLRESGKQAGSVKGGINHDGDMTAAGQFFPLQHHFSPVNSVFSM